MAFQRDTSRQTVAEMMNPSLCFHQKEKKKEKLGQDGRTRTYTLLPSGLVLDSRRPVPVFIWSASAGTQN